MKYLTTHDLLQWADAIRQGIQIVEAAIASNQVDEARIEKLRGDIAVNLERAEWLDAIVLARLELEDANDQAQ